MFSELILMYYLSLAFATLQKDNLADIKRWMINW